MRNLTIRLGDLLLQDGYISQQQLDEALQKQKKTNRKLGEILVEEGIVTEAQILKTLEYKHRIPSVNLYNMEIKREIPLLVTESFAKKSLIIPITLENGVLTVAMYDPLDYHSLDEIQRLTGYEVKAVISTKTDITRAIDRYYGSEKAARAVEELKKETAQSDIMTLSDISENELTGVPVVRLFNSIVNQAVKIGASDIHIEPGENDMRIRFRVDGVMQDIMRSTKSAHPALITRIKIMGGMDIAEKRIPQDGRAGLTADGRDIDLRMSILPTVNGEKVVIRLLGVASGIHSIEKLGLSEKNRTLFKRCLNSAHGIFLVSGPTGSGKTTTLYAALQDLNRADANIVTVEDPVEYRLDGINQVQVNQKAGLTFANGLRSILRQDPDIIMIGEIRDSETAQIAIRAAITGHLVLSTIHTNDAASSIIRLVDMGVEPYLVSSSVVGVVAQRLVRCVCKSCRIEYTSTPEEMKSLGIDKPIKLNKGVGCAVCSNTGYLKRVAVHEVLVVNREIRELIDRRATTDEIQKAATHAGTITLRQSCLELVLSGVTTVEEFNKVTYDMDAY
ncbi:MAG: GspE/PulE family protein [Eubacteriales bacterium]